MSGIPRFLIRLTLALAISGVSPLVAAVAAAQNAPQSPPKSPSSSPAVQVPARPADESLLEPKRGPLPVDIEHVRQEAQKRPAVRLDDEKLRFYVLVLVKAPRFEDFVGAYDLKNGPTRGGAAMTHQEFLNMVTPKELNELFGGTNGNSFALFQAAAMNAIGQFFIKKAIADFRAARNEREVQAIRQRIDRELEALLGRTP